MKVYGDDLVTPVEEGMNAAESIQFRINQRQASITSGSSIWNDGATVALDIQMEATTVQNIDLQVGWNLVSFRLDPSNEDPKLFFASINGSYTSIRTYEWRENQMKPTVCFPEPYSIYNTMDKVDVRLGYQIKVTQAVTLQITGTPVPVGMKYPLRNGWNMIAYPGLVPLAVSTGLAPIDLPARFTTVRTWVYESGSMRPRFHYPAPFDVYSTFSELQPEQGILIRMLYSSPPDPEVFEIVYPESVMSLPE
jgi:hypothetical protein